MKYYLTKLKRRLDHTDPGVSMIYISFFTFLTGILLLSPYDTFNASRSWLYLSQHGTEGIWGLIFFIIGLLLIGHCIREFSARFPPRPWERFTGKCLWQFTSPFYIFVGTSCLISNPGSMITIMYVLSGGMAWWIARQMLKRKWEK